MEIEELKIFWDAKLGHWVYRVSHSDGLVMSGKWLCDIGLGAADLQHAVTCLAWENGIEADEDDVAVDMADGGCATWTAIPGK